MVSCGGEGDPSVNTYDQNNETADEETTDETTDVTDEEVTDENVVDEEEVPDEVEDNNTETPDDSQFQKVGDFNLMFNGKINTDLSNYQSIRGGEGDVNFSYNGMNLTFTKQTVIIIQLFPLAILQGSNVAVMWLDSAPGLSAETKQVFGFTFPSTVTPGDQTMEAAQAYAFYGDINVNVQGGQFDVKCVRGAAIMGSFNVMSYDGANANFSAMGDLLDPSAAGSQLPYPVCTD
jgi:hypothetical protein